MTEGLCDTYCSHGGVCELEDGHAGLHSSGYCEWQDEDSIDKAMADDRLFDTVSKRGSAAEMMLARLIAAIT